MPYSTLILMHTQSMLKAEVLNRDIGLLSLQASPTLSDHCQQHVTMQAPYVTNPHPQRNIPRDLHVGHAFMFLQLHLRQPELHGSDDPQHHATVHQAACQEETPHLP